MWFGFIPLTSEPSMNFNISARHIACVAGGPRTCLSHLYSLYRRFRVFATQATRHIALWGIWKSLIEGNPQQLNLKTVQFICNFKKPQHARGTRLEVGVMWFDRCTPVGFSSQGKSFRARKCLPFVWKNGLGWLLNNVWLLPTGTETTTGSPGSKYEHRRASALLRITFEI